MHVDWDDVRESVRRDHLRFLALVIVGAGLPLSAVYANRGTPAVLALALGCAAAGLVADRRCGRPAPVAARPAGPVPLWATVFLLALAYMGLSSLWAAEPLAAVERSGKLAVSALMGLALYFLLPRVEGQLWGRIGLMGLAVAACACIVEFAAGGLVSPLLYGPNLSTLNRSVIILGLFLWPVLALSANRGLGGWQAFAVILVAAAIFLSRSQSAMLGLLVASATAAAAFVSRRLAAFGVAAAGAVAFLAAPFLAMLLYRNLPNWLAGIGAGGSPHLRLEIWNAAGEAALEHPLIGAGVGAGRLLEIDPERARELGAGITNHHPHSAMLQIWVELGMLGAAVFAAIFVGLVLAVSRLASHRQVYAYAALASALSVAAVSHGAWQTWWLNLLIISLVLLCLPERASSVMPAAQREPVQAAAVEAVHEG